eukprot:m51a1_g6941 putative serine incorporator 3 (444) ;mRNA; r:242867-245295
MCFTLACCACEACAGATCRLCGRAVPVSMGRVGYVVLFLVVALAAWCTGSYLPVSAFDKLHAFAQCPADSRSCYLTLTVTRAMFAMAVFHLAQALLMIGVRNTSDFRHSFQEGWWPLKLPLLAGIITASVFIPNKFYIGYEWVSLVGAGVFILVQLIMLIDFACDWAHNWIEKMEDAADDGSCNRWYAALLSCSAFMFAGALTITVLLYVFYTQKHGEGTCPKGALNAFFVTFNMILCIVVTLVSVLPVVREHKPDSGIFQSSVVCVYTSYLVFSALASEPRPWTRGCNSLWNTASDSTGGQNAVIIIGAIMTILAVCYSTFRVSGTDPDKFGLESKPAEGDGDDRDDEPLVGRDEEDGPVTYNHSAFHVIFMLGCMYTEQLLTNWQVITNVAGDGKDATVNVDSGAAAVWVKIVSGWIVFGLYVWSMVAPSLFPDRDFGTGV